MELLLIDSKARNSASLEIVVGSGLLFAQNFVRIHHLSKLLRISFISVRMQLKEMR